MLIQFYFKLKKILKTYKLLKLFAINDVLLSVA